MSEMVASLLAFVVAAGGTGLLRRYALRSNLVDVPNHRSSHEVPTPRGGGLAIVVGASLAFAILGVRGGLDLPLLLTLLVGGGVVAATGFLDDRYQLRAGTRLVIHMVAAGWAVYWCGGLSVVQIGEHTFSIGWIGYVLECLAIVWMLNLFNFMDGIDGLAASEATFAAWAAAGLALMTPMPSGVSAASIAFGAACCGFLLWNWAPAKIFMGDTGSGYLGYVLAVLALAMSRNYGVFASIWLILVATFVVDATVTLIGRLVRGERVHQAHRSHAYQWLSRRWRSHRRVSAANMAINLLWLLPCAVIAKICPQVSISLLGLALAPLIAVVIIAGAGRPES